MPSQVSKDRLRLSFIHSLAFRGARIIVVCWLTVSECFTAATSMTLQHKVEGCAASKRLNSKRQNLLIQWCQFSGKYCASRAEFTARLWPSQEKNLKYASAFVVFPKRSSSIPLTTRPQLQGNQTPFFSLTGKVILTYSSIQRSFGKMFSSGGFIHSPATPGNYCDTAMTHAIQIYCSCPWADLISHRQEP